MDSAIGLIDNKPQCKFSISSLNLNYGYISFDLIQKENGYVSLNGRCNIKTSAISGNICVYEKEQKWQDREKLSLSFIPYRKIQCSIAISRDDGYFEEAEINLNYRFKKHRFEVSLRRNFLLSNDFPSVKYEYKKGGWQFSLLNSGENFNQIFCALSCYLHGFGNFTQTFQYDRDSYAVSFNSRFSGSIIVSQNSQSCSADSAINRGKIFVHIFLDKNYNGIFENNIDQSLKQIRINIDGKPSRFTTADNGTAWIKTSFPRKMYIGADFENLPFRSIPDKPAFVDLLGPTAVKVQIPVYLTAEIMGVDEGNALKIQLAGKKTGRIIAESDVLSDGTFYFNKVIPGDYILIAGDRRKEVTIKVDENGEPISVLDIIIKK